MKGRVPLTRRHVLAGLATLPIAGPALGRATDFPRIDVEGNRLTYGSKHLRLTGLAVGDPLYIRASRSAADYRVIAGEWRANCVRISMLPGLWREDRAAALGKLHSDVSQARAASLFVVIDWHAIGFPGHYEPMAPADWGLPADVHVSTLEEAAQFWREIASAYAHDPAVLFELWNEPSIDALFWAATGEHWPLFHAAWTELIAVIREHADNIVICAGGYWAHDLVGVRDLLIDDPRVIYAWHCYPNAERGDMAARLSTLGELQHIKPVIVTEWGYCDSCSDELQATTEDFAAPLVTDIFDRYQLSHLAWCYSEGAMPNLLQKGGGLSAFGSFVQQALQRAALDETCLRPS